MKWNFFTKHLKLSVYAFVAMAFASCVPDAGKQTATCDSGKSYNSTTQTCEQSEFAPGQTLTTYTMTEDQGDTTITLTYSDDNGDLASSCRVVEAESNFEMESPIAQATKDDAFALITKVSSAVSSMVVGSLQTNVSALVASSTTYYTAATDTDDYSTVSANLRAVANDIQTAITNLQQDTLSATSTSTATQAQILLDAYETSVTFVENKCYCSGGICTSVIKVDENVNGSFGFQYSVDDTLASASSLQTVQVNVDAFNDQPIPVDYHDGTLVEDTPASPQTYTLTLPSIYDVEGGTHPFWTYVPTSSTTQQGGTISCSFNSCTYTPPSSDTSTTSEARPGALATSTFGDLTLTAIAEGSDGNQISLEILSHPLTNTGSNVDIEVTGGNTFKVYIQNGVTTCNEVVTAMSANEYITAKVTLSCAVGTTPIVNQTQTFLTGGSDAYDYFYYYATGDGSVPLLLGMVSVDMAAADDDPVNGSSSPSVLTEDTNQTITLAYTDAESDSATACTVSANTNLEFQSACVCASGVCTVDVRSTTDNTSNATFDYTVTAGGLTSSSTTHTMSVTAVNDLPVPSPANFTIMESANALPTTEVIDLSSKAAYDPEDLTITYTVISENGGTVSNCMAGTNDIVCDFTPSDGNLSGTTGVAATATGLDTSLVATANAYGTWANSNVTVQITNNAAVTGCNVVVETTFPTSTTVNINALTCSTTTDTQIQAAINTDSKSARIVTMSGATGTTVVGNDTATMSGGVDSVASFTYKATDSAGDSEFIATVAIEITAVDDLPVICDYSSYGEANECGLNGCIGSTDPTSITPSTDGLRYYDSSTSICYVSASGSWSIISNASDYIPNQVANQLGTVVIDKIKVDEGDGVGDTEITQYLEIRNLASSDSTLIPPSNITFNYNGSDITLPSVGDAGISADDNEMKITIIPQAGLTGSSTITFDLYDVSSGGVDQGFVSVSFDVEVMGNTILHNGWKNITALGPKTNKFAQLPDEEQVCTYSETKCNSGSACTGTTAPTGTVVPDEAYAFYYDSVLKNCYYATTASDSSSWTLISSTSYCAVSPSEYETGCSGIGASCYGTSSPSGAVTPVTLNSMFFDTTTNTCYRSTGTTATDWEVYDGPATVNLQWESFTLLGSGTITGYNIYRRLAGEEFDYTLPINRTMLASSDTEYVDNHTNSRFPAIPGTVYYYEVVPVVQDTDSSSNTVTVPTPASENFSTVRVVAPHSNKAFAHRWVINKTMCEKMHSTTIDPTNEFRCEYAGPGDTLISGTRYYDIGKDLIVDRFEAGCRYTIPSDGSSCSGAAADGSCIAQGDPTVLGVTGTTTGDVYYDRSAGGCYRWNGAWNAIDGTTHMVANYNIAELPPLTNVTQAQAFNFCSDSSVSTGSTLGACEYTSLSCDTGANCTGTADPLAAAVSADSGGEYYFKTDTSECFYASAAGTASWAKVYGSGLAQKLPSRKEQIVYGDWNFDDNTDFAVTTFEEGLSLNSSAKCNSSSASGLTSYFTDTDTPGVSSLFTIPGTDSSGIRSLMTGSSQTNLCVSRFGIQDTVGNVAEWVEDRLTCSDSFNCYGLVNGDANVLTSTTDMATDGAVVGDFDVWRIGYSAVGTTPQIGPCGDTSQPCTTAINTMTLGLTSANSNRVAMPMGLPMATSYNSSDTNLDPVGPYMLLANNSSGLTTTQGHNDVFTYNTATIFADANNTAGMATGGSYLDGTAAGTYNHTMIPINNAGQVDVGFRCVAPVTTYLE